MGCCRVPPQLCWALHRVRSGGIEDEDARWAGPWLGMATRGERVSEMCGWCGVMFIYTGDTYLLRPLLTLDFR